MTIKERAVLGCLITVLALSGCVSNSVSNSGMTYKEHVGQYLVSFNLSDSFTITNSSGDLVYKDHYESIYNHSMGGSYDPIKYTMKRYSINITKPNNAEFTLYMIPISSISSNQGTDIRTGSDEYLNKLVYNIIWEHEWFRGSSKEYPQMYVNGFDVRYSCGHKKYDEIYECVAAYYPLPDTIALVISRSRYQEGKIISQDVENLINSTKIERWQSAL